MRYLEACICRRLPMQVSLYKDIDTNNQVAVKSIKMQNEHDGVPITCLRLVPGKSSHDWSPAYP